MTEKTLLVHTIGNRDVQFVKSIEDKIAQELMRDNPEDGAHWVLQVGLDQYETFWDRTKVLADYLETAVPRTQEYWYHQMYCPMLESVVQYVVERDLEVGELWLLSTGQLPPYGPYAKDTYHAARLIQQYIIYQKQQKEITPFDAIGKVKVLRLTCNLQEDRQGILYHVYQWLENAHLEFRDVYISNKSGLPKVAEALNLAGILTDYHYLSSYKNRENGHQIVIEDNLDTQHNVILSLVKQYLANGGKFL